MPGIYLLQKMLMLGALFAMLITLLAAPAVVGVFRRKVATSMNRTAQGDDIHDGAAGLPAGGIAAGRIPGVLPRVRAGARLRQSPRGATLAPTARAKLGRIALAYACGGAAQAAVITLVLLLGGNSVYASPAAGLPVLMVLALPVVPTVSHVLAIRPAVRAAWVIGALALALVAAGDAAGLVWRVFALYILVPAAIYLVFSLRYWRASAPLVLVLAFGASLGWLALIELGRLMVGDGAAIWLFRLGGLAAGACLAMPVARRIGARYAARRTSEQMLFIDIWWLLLTLIETAMLLATRDSLVQLLALSGYAAYWSVSRVLLKGRHSDQAPAARLLLLRVFGHDRRIERLLDELALRWRPLGTVEMIAGRDLALRNVDPSELYGFLSGGLAREFVKDSGDLARRLAGCNRRQDPDGLYRLTQYFCHRDTWQRTLDALVAGCDGVLMDLRGFDERRLGCRYEIGRLAERVGEKPIVLLTDSTTRLDLAESLFLAAVPPPRQPALRSARHVFILEAGASPAQTVATASCLLLGGQPA